MMNKLTFNLLIGVVTILVIMPYYRYATPKTDKLDKMQHIRHLTTLVSYYYPMMIIARFMLFQLVALLQFCLITVMYNPTWCSKGLII